MQSYTRAFEVLSPTRRKAQDGSLQTEASLWCLFMRRSTGWFERDRPWVRLVSPQVPDGRFRGCWEFACAGALPNSCVEKRAFLTRCRMQRVHRLRLIWLGADWALCASDSLLI
ncbi:unnamed protein product [Chondrus crispus]|uniref:Uncharacterized protein n=1 Tax=Chondrus crispus TaxID=2769 RepID=R7Q5M7_CHOCR|nr:unnamed protein product [Chondrus crispus]CDF33837.1 unnamed protein product [Chondrus crispus]|eukprot:XP_005713656.1 unnamed protein product [Chondrus crispus]